VANARSLPIFEQSLRFGMALTKLAARDSRSTSSPPKWDRCSGRRVFTRIASSDAGWWRWSRRA